VGPRAGERLLFGLGDRRAREEEVDFVVLGGALLEDVKVVLCVQVMPLGNECLV